MDYQEIREQTARALEELLNASQLKRGDIFIVGCSTSEVMGQRIGKGSSLDAAKAVYEGLYPALHERGIALFDHHSCNCVHRYYTAEQRARGMHAMIGTTPFAPSVEAATRRRTCSAARR